MNVVFKIPAHFSRLVRHDLDRPHRFAWERVGFLAGRPGALGHNEFVILARAIIALPTVTMSKAIRLAQWSDGCHS